MLMLNERGIQMLDNTHMSLLDRILERYQHEKQSDTGKRRYPAATEEQLRATEEALGFTLPFLLRACYLRVSNGGFGPGEGVMGVIGGFEDSRGNIVEAYLWRRQYYRPIDLAECERQATESPWKDLPFQTVSSKVLKPPDDTWPSSLLEFYHHGCGDFSSLDLKTDRIFVGGNPFLWYEANSLEEWLERWLRDDSSANVRAWNHVDPFLPQWPSS